MKNITDLTQSPMKKQFTKSCFSLESSTLAAQGQNIKYSAVYLVLVYTAMLGLAALLSAWYPSQIASFVHFFLPIDMDLTNQSFIRYRMFLWLIATMVFLVIVPVVGYFGIPETNLKKIQSFSWWYVVFVILVFPISWIFYPIMSLCTTCIISSDAVYFALTVSFFLALQAFAQVIILKTQLFFGKK